MIPQLHINYSANLELYHLRRLGTIKREKAPQSSSSLLIFQSKFLCPNDESLALLNVLKFFAFANFLWILWFLPMNNFVNDLQIINPFKINNLFMYLLYSYPL
jgi:hypothetical protein